MADMSVRPLSLESLSFCFLSPLCFLPLLRFERLLTKETLAEMTISQFGSIWDLHTEFPNTVWICLD